MHEKDETGKWTYFGIEVEILERLIAAGEGETRMMTLAPELDGALALISRLRERGIIAAIGHSEGTALLVAVRSGLPALLIHATLLIRKSRRMNGRIPEPPAGVEPATY